MKIGLLTHPLKSNYGGILQNYALHASLKKMGHEVTTINIGKRFNTLGWIKNILKYPIKKIVNPKEKLPLTIKQINYIEQNIDLFINKHISTTEPLIRISKHIIDKYNFDIIIVGSDQVWRPGYVNNIKDMFLCFLGDSKIRRIAFAASFGIDYWTFTKKQELICAREIKKFNAISVREESGIELCKKFFHVVAEQIMDPTILLSKEEYIALININDRKKSSSTQLTAYILDVTRENQEEINIISSKLHAETIYINNHNVKNSTVNYTERVVPPIENWIAGFINADYVITDSYHGTIFSIIFNKPFITIENKRRGLTRISSLLKCFRLEKQLITNTTFISNFDNVFNVDFSWANKILEVEKNRSIRFLKDNIK